MTTQTGSIALSSGAQEPRPTLISLRGGKRPSPAAGAVVVPVGLGEGCVESGEIRMAVHGLGSCVALCLHDPETGLGGLCHIVLPNRGFGRADDPPSKFADSAVSWLAARMVERGANRSRLVAKIAGGASLFSAKNAATSNIGQRNIEAVRSALEACGIPLVAEHVGGSVPRTIVFRPGDGRLEVSFAGRVAEVL